MAATRAPTLTITHLTTATAILNIDGVNFLTDPFFGATEGNEYDAGASCSNSWI
jgi:L-ascorbate metabolism protein UlaG (beta-lactamase superfamily)